MTEPSPAPERAADPDARPPAAGPRPLTPADLPRLVELEAELFGAGAWSAGMLAEELAAPGRWYVGIDVDGALAGYAGLWFDGDVTQVMPLGVAGAAQRGGIGATLLDALIATMRRAARSRP